jgi:hypothetical protein
MREEIHNMTLRNLLATDCLLVGWVAFVIFVCSALTANVTPWRDALPELWFLAAACIGTGVFLRRDSWQRETNMAVYLEGRSRFQGLDVDVPGASPDQWPDGLLGIVWLP